MPRILLVKTSSLGDVIHNLPVATDIAGALPGVEIDWVVEESLATLPALHGSVARVIPVAVRRWRRRFFSGGVLTEIRAFADELRSRDYDAVIDTQGLFKSAIVTRIARGRRFGLGWKASREPLFPFYHRTFDVPRALHAVERNRTLAARALQYTPAARVDYAIRAPAAEFPWLGSAPYAVLIHATSARAKLWPEARWTALGQSLLSDGVRCVLPWGTEEERARSVRLAAVIPDAVIPPKLELGAVASLVAGARCAIGVDTGVTHLACALGVATVGVYISTDPAATGLYGSARAENVGGPAAAPSVEAIVQVLRRLSQ
jgi:heptosyltransferase-1